MVEQVAAIFAHPDDEILGCGGTLARHAEAGAEVRILLLATGLAARATTGSEQIDALRAQARRAANVVGARASEFADCPDNAMDTVPLLEVVKRIEEFLADGIPERIYTHHGGDLNVDHRIVQRAVVTAARPLPDRGPMAILAAEVNSSTEWAAPPLMPFQPTEFVDISSSLETKLQALTCYQGELRDWPHPRSIEGVRALARWRGTQCGRHAAEAFVTLRRIDAG